MKRKTILKQGRCVAMAACALLIGTAVMQSCADREDNILTGQPDWLGNSIYERLEQEGNYTTMLRLIDDLNMKEVLGHTGSRTLFPANDQAFNEWYRTNQWGIRSYAQLSTPRKKLMLNNAMISNAYLIELLSNVSGNPPKEGLAMRRNSSGSVLDSVLLMKPEDMPTSNAWWNTLRSRGKKVPFIENGRAPMIHFLRPFMKYYNITDNDLSIMTNHKSNSVADSWINGRKVVEADITCKNGYIHRVDGVVEASPNMAEALRQHKQLSTWSRLVDRFSAPYLASSEMRENYNRMYNNEDSLFVRRYFSKQAGHELNYAPDGITPVPAQLSFDPGWNEYMYTNTLGYDLHYDAGAMIVPTNEAVENWWNNDGRDLQDEYGELDSIPYETLAKLINVNMLDNFTEKVPSKFDHVLDDAKEVLGIKPTDIDSCFMCCNGVVYVVNKVFSPREYASVAYPALAHKSTMDVFYWAVDVSDTDNGKGTFLPYLLSMDAKYVLLMPTNNAMTQFIDPATYGDVQTGTTTESPKLIEFWLDPTKKRSNQMQASRYICTVDENGNITRGTRTQLNVDTKVVYNMLDNMLNQQIIVLPPNGPDLETYLQQGYHYFKTKGGTLIYAEIGGDGKPVFAGGWQLEHNKRLSIKGSVFKKQNGDSYMLDEQMPLGAQKSLFMTLKEHEEYSAFLNLISCDYSEMLKEKMSDKYPAGNTKQGNKNFSLFDNYNYTVFVPTNQSIIDLQTAGVLPTARELTIEEKTDYDIIDSLIVAENWAPSTDKITDNLRDSVTTAIRKVITDFVRYHVQDHSVAIGMVPEPGQTSSAYESMLRNPDTGRFYQLTTNFDVNQLTVKDLAGNTRTVQKTDGLYNNMCREYYFTATGNTAQLFMGSDAMVHQIDKPLFISNDLKKWRDVVSDYLKK
ncbi:MAG: fasciclin domain-containing protein [Prevotella sp.]|nr:fasciclin domain-containing protein [Prevotella sp.]